jgi:hypothetical protein
MRWVRLYLGCYLRLVKDDRCDVLENSSLSHHFTTREEELFEISAVSFKHIVTLLCQGVKGRLEDVVLVEVRSVDARVSTLSCLTCLK